MTPQEIKYNRRYKTGEYEHEDFTVTAALDPKDDVSSCFSILRADVHNSFTGETAAAAETANAIPAASIAEPGKKNKKGKDKEEPKAEEEEDEEVPADEEEESEEEEEESEDEEESEEEEESEDEDEAPPADEGKGKKKFKKKPQVYSRKNEQHKDLFSSLLRVVAPDWKKTDSGKQKAKDVSAAMEGKEFLDEEGGVLEAFKSEVKKKMSKK